jgi:hypothetical protein
MKGVRFCDSVLILLLVGQPAFAETTLDGNALRRACRNVEQMVEQPEEFVRGPAIDGFFAGYCLGVVHGVKSFGEVIFTYMEREGLTKPVCFPKGITNEHAARMVLKYLIDHPENLRFDTATIVAVALAEAFPCGKQ